MPAANKFSSHTRTGPPVFGDAADEDAGGVGRTASPVSTAAAGEARTLPSDALGGSSDSDSPKRGIQSPRAQSAESTRRSRTRSRKSAADLIPIERECIFAEFMTFPSTDRIARKRGINRLAALETVVYEQGIELRNGYGGRPARKPMGRAGVAPARSERGVA